MIEDQLERIAISLGAIVELLGKPPVIMTPSPIMDQLVPDTMGGLTPTSSEMFKQIIPGVVEINGQVFAPPSTDAAGTPVHHTGTFIAPPPADDDAPGDGIGPDSAGHFWDTRIHMDAKTKIKKTGEWKLKRKVDPNLVAQVFGEQAVEIGRVVTVNGVAPTGQAANPIAGPPPTATPGAPPPLAAIGTTALTMKDFVTKVVAAGYTMETMQPFLATHGITALPLLVKSPELIPVILAEMGVM